MKTVLDINDIKKSIIQYIFKQMGIEITEEDISFVISNSNTTIAAECKHD